MADKRIELRCERIEPDKPNLNERTYPRAVLEQMVAQGKKKAGLGNLFGRLGTFARPVTMRDVSHRIVDVRLDEDGRVACDCEILDTESGKALRDFVVSNRESLEVVPYGMGSVADGVIGEDYKLITFDIVHKVNDNEFGGLDGSAQEEA